MQTTLNFLNSLNIPHEVKITSAHRTPEATHAVITKDAELTTKIGKKS